MDAHDADGIRIFILHVGFAVIDIVFLHLFHVADKVKQAEIACFFKIFRTG